MGILISNESTTDRNIRFLQKGALALLILFIIIGFVISCVFAANLSPVDGKDNNVYQFTIKEGEPKVTVIHNLKEQDLIKNEFFSKLYLKVNDGFTFYVCVFVNYIYYIIKMVKKQESKNAKS